MRYRWAVLAAGTAAQTGAAVFGVGLPVIAPTLQTQYGLIAEMSLAITSEATAHDILASIHPHPTLSEVMFEATAVALGEAVHI